ncbi:MAG: TonB-dependent receptor domain-containing protein [Candidatus Kapaibacterium sp.]
MKFKIFIAAIAFLCAINSSQAQKPDMEKLKNAREAVVKGKVIDNESDRPLAYANAKLFRKKDSSLVSGAIADKEGIFTIDKLPYGLYFLKLNFIGYEPIIKDNILLTPKNKKIDVGTNYLSQSTVTTEDVEVTAEKEIVEFKVDRKIININKDIASSGGNAADALAIAPQVNVDIEGNVSLRGSENFTVYINGKPSVLDGTEALRQIPASSIEHIEIITNPSAKYDPEGLAGIINIITKENFLDGISGMTSINGGMYNEYGIDVNFNWNLEKLSLNTGFDYGNNTWPGESESRNISFAQDTFYLFSDSERDFERNRLNLKLGAAYDFTDKLSMTLNGGFGSRNRDHINESLNESYYNTITDLTYSESISEGDNQKGFYSISYNLNYRINDLGEKLDLTAFFSDEWGDGTDLQEEFYTGSDYQTFLDYRSGTRSNEDETENELRITLDYVKPFSKNTKFEAGFHTDIENSDEDYEFFLLDTNSGQWNFSDRFSNEMLFDRYIYAGYFLWASTIAGFDYQLGLRGEYTNRMTDFQIDSYDKKIERLDYFPSVHISRKFPGMNQIMASYSRRINRPRGHWLDPFPNYMNTYSYRIGNPALEPEYTDSYELGYQKIFSKFMFMVEGFYRYTDNMMERIQRLDEEGNFVYTSQNYGSSESVGAEFMLNYRPGDKLNLNLVSDVFHYSISGDDGRVRSTESWGLRFFGDYNIMSSLKMQLRAFYRGPSITSQGDRDGFLYSDLGLKYDITNNLTMTLSLQDLLDSRKHEFTTNTPNVSSYFKFNRLGRQVSVTLNYRFNNYKQDRRGSRENVDEGDADFF